ncbi:S8 family serine peptidase [Micromonospora krabiensis]|uniref:Type VII secretion-associated serine protease mycosin n=1 Tax=Micromonospora krabiensis TaxID=307121 RepID=A0A1C3MXM3_9ACTN|nr:S8 family serine peptidase [Micromonospora krabiensis]SBV25069.1 type VII secretion-associated serine protease mycosin [Micromonospora krabiensis]
MNRPDRARAIAAALLLGAAAVPAIPASAAASPTVVRSTLAADVTAGAGDTLPARVRPGAVAAPPAGSPPVLPTVTQGCVGESPVVAKSTPWAVRRVLPTAAWPLTRGEGVVVAVLDTGVSPAATALTGAVRRGNDVVGSGGGDRDCFGRGTALAGIVAARPLAGTGFVGVAPGATILPIRVVDARGKVPPGAIAAGIRAATAARADVILVGLGTTGGDPGLRAAIRDAVARDIVLVAAVAQAKQTGTTPSPPWYPAAHPDVLAVGGIDVKGTLTEQSPPEAGVDLVAPASDAVSVAPRGDGHYAVTGAAVAAAYVAGAAALVRAYHPALSQAEVRQRLELTAEHPPGAWPTAGAGYGMLDLYQALSAVEPSRPPLTSRPDAVRPLPKPGPTEPTRLIAGSVSAGIAGLAGLAYLAAMTVKWGRRRRWRP